MQTTKCGCGQTLRIKPGLTTFRCPVCKQVSRLPGTQPRPAVPNRKPQAQAMQRSLASTQAYRPPPKSPARPVPSRSPNHRAAKRKPAASSTKGWWIFGAVAFTSVAVVAVAGWFVLHHVSKSDTELLASTTDATQSVPQSTREGNSPASTSDSGASKNLVRVATYPAGPRLASTTEFFPQEFLDRLENPIEDYMFILPPEQNAAPQYLRALSFLSPDLAKRQSDDDDSATPFAAQQLVAAIESADEQFRSSHQVSPSIDFSAGDEVYKRLEAAQKLAGCSFLPASLFRDAAADRPVFLAFENLAKLTKLRAAQRAGSGSVRITIQEMRITIGAAAELERNRLTKPNTSEQMQQSMFDEVVPLVLRDSKLTADEALAQCRVLAASQPADPYLRTQFGLKTYFLNIHGFLFEIEQADAAGRRAIVDRSTEMNEGSSGKNADRNSEQYKQNMEAVYLMLNSMTAENLLMNWNKCGEMMESAIPVFEVPINEQAAEFRRMNLNIEEQLERATKAQQLGNLNSEPWLVLGLAGKVRDLWNTSNSPIARQRMACVQSAIRWIELSGRPPVDSAQQALDAAGVKASAVNPYDGSPLKIERRDDHAVVYWEAVDRKQKTTKHYLKGWEP